MRNSVYIYRAVWTFKNRSAHWIHRHSRIFCRVDGAGPYEAQDIFKRLQLHPMSSSHTKSLFTSATGKMCKSPESPRVFWRISRGNSQYFLFCQAKQVQPRADVNIVRCVADGKAGRSHRRWNPTTWRMAFNHGGGGGLIWSPSELSTIQLKKNETSTLPYFHTTVDRFSSPLHLIQMYQIGFLAI